MTRRQMGYSNILTLHPEKKRGYSIPIDVYDEIKTFLIGILEKNREVLLNDLFDVAKNVQFSVLDDDTSWYLLIVKLDLEARGVITCTWTPGYERNQILKIKKREVKRTRRLIHG